ELGMATHNYHDAVGEFPSPRPIDPKFGGFISAGSVSNGRFPYSEQNVGSWLYRLLPYMEQGNVQALALGATTVTTLLTKLSTVRGTTVPAFQCPSDPRAGQPFVQGTRVDYLTSYVGVTGTDEVPTGGNASNGFFPVGWQFPANGQRLRVKVGSVLDGTSNTVAAGERPPSADLQFGGWFLTDTNTILGCPNYATNVSIT